MARTLDTAEFLQAKTVRPVFDVRSPGEFLAGHIPGALSFPLFSDEERARVGTVYKQQGPEPAYLLGLEIVGPKMAGFVRQAKKLAAGEGQIAVHCWRGGQRSRSMAWLLESAGFEAVLLAGGYKFYRRHLLEGFEKLDLKLCVVGGRTGTGKTKILHELARQGEQIIDLEAIAHHKGSAFGSIGEAPQPTVEQFENDLFDAASLLDPLRRVWLENESQSIGRVFVPLAFWAKMKGAPLVNIEIPQAARIQNLLDDYAKYPAPELAAAFQKIDRKLGGQHLKNALAALEKGDYAAAAEIALWYYDKTYQHGLDTNLSPLIRSLVFSVPTAAAEIAAACRALAEHDF